MFFLKVGTGLGALLIIIPLQGMRVGEFIEIRQKKFHPPVY
jgi:hypothetical protein